MAAEELTPQAEHAAALSIVSNWDEPKAQESAPAAATDSAPSVAEVAQPAADTTAQAGEGEQQTAAERQEEIRKHKLRYHDEEIEVDDNELRTGYLKGKDYTVKTQEIARQRAELDATIKARVEPAVKVYQENLRTLEAAVLNALEPRLRNTDWNRLAAEDPGEWARQMQAANNINATLQAVKAEQKRLEDEKAEGTKQQRLKDLREAADTLQRDIPGFNHEHYGKAVGTAVRLGMKQEQASEISDPSVVKALHYAGLYLALQDGKPQVEKLVQQVPKVVKPGAGERPDGKTEKWNTAMSKLKKSGKEHDALAVAKFLVG